MITLFFFATALDCCRSILEGARISDHWAVCTDRKTVKSLPYVSCNHPVLTETLLIAAYIVNLSNSGCNGKMFPLFWSISHVLLTLFYTYAFDCVIS